jgi:hypothetical protein
MKSTRDLEIATVGFSAKLKMRSQVVWLLRKTTFHTSYDGL